ncbi:hypothetical protein LCGC14_2246310 [marine sediment metagenome]|uniref:Uncharacterized protein n=1 Tax=marine sediment metagenome TaxID=412755 RepID=A0A0F9FGI6_9ZZZZ
MFKRRKHRLLLSILSASLVSFLVSVVYPISFILSVYTFVVTFGITCWALWSDYLFSELDKEK